MVELREEAKSQDALSACAPSVTDVRDAQEDSGIDTKR
jgi:hypothetical protein